MVMSAYDIMLILDVSLRTAQRIRRDIKEAFCKKRWHEVTVPEFCEYTAISEDEVQRYFWGLESG